MTPKVRLPFVNVGDEHRFPFDGLPPGELVKVAVQYPGVDLTDSHIDFSLETPDGTVLRSSHLPRGRASRGLVAELPARVTSVNAVLRATLLAGPITLPRPPRLVAVKRPKAYEDIFSARSRTVALATYPARASTYLRTIESLLGQCDNVMVYLNDYVTPPDELLTHAGRHKIHFILDPRGNRRAAAKFTWAHEPGYHIICDDDIVYPPDYVERLVDAIERYRRTAIVGTHAVTYCRHVENWLTSRTFARSFRAGQSRDIAVHQLGTGTIAFHSDTVAEFDWRQLERMNIANDPALAVEARRKGVHMISVARKAGWLRSVSPGGELGIFEQKTLYPELSAPDTALLRAAEPWDPPVAAEVVREGRPGRRRRGLFWWR